LKTQISLDSTEILGSAADTVDKEAEVTNREEAVVAAAEEATVKSRCPKKRHTLLTSATYQRASFKAM